VTPYIGVLSAYMSDDVYVHVYVHVYGQHGGRGGRKFSSLSSYFTRAADESAAEVEEYDVAAKRAKVVSEGWRMDKRRVRSAAALTLSIP
jgi:hypothetical protein